MLAGLGPDQLGYWLGTLWFVGLAAAIWHGNRWLLFEQRRHLGWFDHPVRKLTTLLAAIVLFTAPLTVVALLAWFGWRGVAPSWAAIQTTTLINIICVVFVTHAYETVFLIKEREGDLLRVARLDRARAEAELASFLAQIDPHFMFNSLNTLGHLIDTDVGRARRFNHDLAAIYRYLLRQRGRSLVPLVDELQFAQAYVELMAVRYGDALRCDLPDVEDIPADAVIPPTGLQLLVENAIKHNEVGAGTPLAIAVEVEVDVERRDGATLVVANRRRPRRSVRESAGVGLANLDERCKLTLGAGIRVDQGDDWFRVHVPLTGPPRGRAP